MRLRLRPQSGKLAGSVTSFDATVAIAKEVADAIAEETAELRDVDLLYKEPHSCWASSWVPAPRNRQYGERRI